MLQIILEALLAGGITTLIGIQVIINIAVVTGLIPVTGMALPFFSAGGTSLLILLASMGILLNISRGCKKALKLIKSTGTLKTRLLINFKLFYILLIYLIKFPYLQVVLKVKFLLH